MTLDAKSAKALSTAHPLLQKLIGEVVKTNPKLRFRILDARRGRADQEKAYALGHSRAHFGQSAHNYSPAIALDIVPVPLDWNDIASFIALSKPILAKAAELKIQISWGGSWSSIKDFPHYELDPWRTYAAQSALFKG